MHTLFVIPIWVATNQVCDSSSTYFIHNCCANRVSYSELHLKKISAVILRLLDYHSKSNHQSYKSTTAINMSSIKWTTDAQINTDKYICKYFVKHTYEVWSFSGINCYTVLYARFPVTHVYSSYALFLIVINSPVWEVLSQRKQSLN
jgi:hypothetical protein